MRVIGEILGILLGFGCSELLVWYFPQFFLAYKLSFSSIFIAVMNGFVATFLGAAIPLWQVTRVSPMAAVTSVANRSNPAAVWRAGIAGLFCLALQASLWMASPSRDFRFYSYMFFGIPIIFLGWALLGPALLVACEVPAAKMLGPIFGLRGGVLLRKAWSRTPWRTGAMIAALMIGVTLFIAVNARGKSLLASWTSPARFPDLFLYSISPITDSRLELLKKEHPEFGDLTELAAFPVKTKPRTLNNGEVLTNAPTTFVAVDPTSFSHLIEMNYIEGDPATAIKQLEDGKHIFVTKEFHILHGLGVGDTFSFLGADGKPIDFTISAVVSSTGMDLVKNYFDMRSLFQ